MEAPTVEYNREPEKEVESYRGSRHRDERDYSRSRSPSRDKYKRRRSRSRSRSPYRERGYYNRRERYGRDRPQRENPPPSEVLGVFGLSSYTRESDLEKLFGEYGRIVQVRIIYDRRSDSSRGFGFINFTNVEDATMAKEKLDGIRLHDRCIRVDFSITQRPHSPTPGEYMGERRPPPRRSYRRSRSPGYDDYRSHRSHGRSRYD